MAATSIGGKRSGSGRKPRQGETATVKTQLRFLPSQWEALLRLCPPKLAPATWLAELVLERNFDRCRACRAWLIPDDKGKVSHKCPPRILRAVG